MIYKFNNSLLYRNKIKGYVVSISYLNSQSEINSDTSLFPQENLSYFRKVFSLAFIATIFKFGSDKKEI